MLLNDCEIAALAVEQKMITPFCPENVSEKYGNKVVSYGLSSAGYDIRLADEFAVFSPVRVTGAVDVKAFNTDALVRFNADVCDIPAHSYVLCRSLETFRMPEDVAATCVGKSTYARVGLIVNVTPLEPGWEGNLTLEISNSSPCPVRVYAGEGIAQLLFHRLSGRPSVTYRDKGGKYMGQHGVTPPKMKA
jgi:dCTP deaminase